MKKTGLASLLPLAMKLTIVYFFIFAGIFTTFANNAGGQGILNKSVSLDVSNTKLKKVLQYIQSEASVNFIFSSKIINADRRVSCSVKDKNLKELLNSILWPLGLDYDVKDDKVVLFRSYDDSTQKVTGIPVRGRVLDESGNALASATVQIKGTNISTVTNAYGEFSLGDVDAAAELIVSYVGFFPKQIEVNNSRELTIVLSATDANLNQVVVIGYGSVKKKDVVGSVNIVAAREAGANTATSPTQLLQGKAAGVQVIQNSGQPGSGAQIIIRGTGSFTSVSPLYVIDGIQGDQNLFNSLSSQDIENITVLKDASSTAIYGASAANGVVIVTTKKARSGAPRISFLSQFGVSRAWKKLDLLKAKDYAELVRDVSTVQSVPVPAKFNTSAVEVDSTDWQDAIFRNALVAENHINLSGGSDRFTYTFSTGYISQQSIVKDFTNNRLNMRVGLEEKVGRFRFGQNLNLRYTRSKGSLAGLIDAINMAPYKPVKDSTIIGGYAIVSNVEDLNNAGNPLQRVELTDKTADEFVFYPQLYGEVKLIKGLQFRTQFSARLGGSKSSEYIRPFTGSNYLFTSRQALAGYGDYSNYVLENFFSYSNDFGKHNFSATLGNSYIDPGAASGLNAAGNNIANDEIRNISVALSQTVTGTNNGYGSTALISYFGRLIYSFDDKYVISASMRRDGASNFGANNRFGNFPGIGLAWKFSEENFIRRNIPQITEAKLRVGWGRTGNNNIAPFLTDAVTYGGSPNGNLVYSLGNAENYVPGITVNRIPNPDLKWEETDQTDVGLDLGLFENRLNLTIDWYKRKNNDLLVFVPLPTSVGIGGTSGVNSDIATNAATAQNQGLEVTIGYNQTINPELNYRISANFAYNKNEVLSLGKQFLSPIRQGTFFNLPAFTYTNIGFPIGSFYGARVDHVARDQAEIDALNEEASKITGVPGTIYQAGLTPGDYIYKDLNGDGTMNDLDQEVLGNPMPKIIYGINAGANFKNFDVNLVVAGVSGLKLANAMRYTTHFADKPHNTTTALLRRWKNPGDITDIARAGQNATSNLRLSDFFIEDGSFLRLRNVTIGYTFGKSTLSHLARNVVTNLRLYVAAENLFTITDYEGYDPEVSTLGNSGGYIFERGIDNGQYPQPQSFLVGLQVGF